MNLEELKLIAGGDKKFIDELLTLFIKGTEEGVKSLRVATDKNDVEGVAFHSHKIASPCRHVGALKLFNLLKEIEKKARDNVSIKEIEPLVQQVEAESVRELDEARKLVG